MPISLNDWQRRDHGILIFKMRCTNANVGCSGPLTAQPPQARLFQYETGLTACPDIYYHKVCRVQLSTVRTKPPSMKQRMSEALPVNAWPLNLPGRQRGLVAAYLVLVSEVSGRLTSISALGDNCAFRRVAVQYHAISMCDGHPWTARPDIFVADRRRDRLADMQTNRHTVGI